MPFSFNDDPEKLILSLQIYTLFELFVTQESQQLVREKVLPFLNGWNPCRVYFFTFQNISLVATQSDTLAISLRAFNNTSVMSRQ